MSQMQRRIDQLVTDSFGDQFFPKAMACLLALREEAITRHEVPAFNAFLQSWRPGLQAASKKPFWEKMCRGEIVDSIVCAKQANPAKIRSRNFYCNDYGEPGLRMAAWILILKSARRQVNLSLTMWQRSLFFHLKYLVLLFFILIFRRKFLKMLIKKW